MEHDPDLLASIQAEFNKVVPAAQRAELDHGLPSLLTL
jgi:hypothetical protein